MEYSVKAEKIKRITEILGANRIPYDRTFTSMLDTGYANDECQDFSDILVEALDKLCGLIPNLPNKKVVAEPVEELTTICAGLCDKRRAEKKLKAYRVNASKQLDVINKLLEQTEDNMEMKKRIFAYLQDAINICKDKLERVSSDKTRENLGICLDKLNQIKAELEKVVDWNSKDALQKASKLGVRLDGWTADIQNIICGRDAIAKLDEGIEIVLEWQKNKSIARKSDIASKKDIEASLPEKTRMKAVVTGINKLTKLDDFMITLEEYNAITEEMSAELKIKEDKSAEYDNIIDKNIADFQVLKQQIQQGKLSPREAKRLGVQYDERINIAKADRMLISGDIKKLADEIRSREIISDRFADLKMMIERKKHDPEVAGRLVQELDFRKIGSVLRGIANAQVVEEVFERIDFVIAKIKSYTNLSPAVDIIFKRKQEEINKLKEEEKHRAKLYGVDEEEEEFDMSFFNKYDNDIDTITLPENDERTEIIRQNYQNDK